MNPIPFTAYLAQAQFSAEGFGTVILALGLLYLAVEMFGRFLGAPASPVEPNQTQPSGQANQPATEQATNPSSQVQTRSPYPQGVDSQTAALIAAAVATTLGTPHKIISVNLATSHSGSIRPWSTEGRRDIYQSHRIR